MAEKQKIGFVGLGGRGNWLLNIILRTCKDVSISCLCDCDRERFEVSVNDFDRYGEARPTCYTDYREMFEKEKPDAVIIASAWESHLCIAVEALRRGIATALEVGGAYSVEDCYELVAAQEQSRAPFMLLENCCFNKTELLVTKMVRDGIFGEIVHCSGAYSHDLRDEITNGNIKKHYRLRNYMRRNCDNYPTHELGPIAKILDINRGNRMKTLVSVASKSAGLEDYVRRGKCEDKSINGIRFRQGDIVNTIITCEGGETISLKLDTSLPCFYDRALTVRGTRGCYNQTGNYVILDEDNQRYDDVNACNSLRLVMDSAKKYEEKYLPDCWKNITEAEMKSGHGGMDVIMLKEFFKALREGGKMPIDVYDAASWMCISALSAQSVALGCASVSIPDFTHGLWVIRKPKDVI